MGFFLFLEPHYVGPKIEFSLGATLCGAQEGILIGSHIMRCPRRNSYWEPHYAAPMIEFSLGHRFKRLPMIFLSWAPHNMAPKIGKIPFFRAVAKKMGNRILNIIQTALMKLSGGVLDIPVS